MILDLWSLLGFLGNILFTGRVIIQWIVSEKEKKSIAPISFWWMSLAGALTLIAYSLVRMFIAPQKGQVTPLPLLVGFIITLVPYSRNLMISYQVTGKWHVLSYFFSGFIFILSGCLLLFSDWSLDAGKYFIIGGIGALVWNTRFFWQWIYAERTGNTDFPISFWYASLTGLVFLVIYTLLTRDPVFILAYIFNVIPITRNIIICRRQKL